MTGGFERPLTMGEIARLAGVSSTTVSHVISGKRPVNAATAGRVRAIIEAAGYAPASAARTLQTGRSLLIGLVVPDITHSFFARIAKGVEETAGDYDYGVIFCSSGQSDLARGRRYLGLLRDHTIDGLVYVGSDTAIDRDELRGLAARFPLVLADEELPEIPSVATVTSDNVAGGRLAARHLHELGHRKVVVLAGPVPLHSTTERVRGFTEYFPNALVLHGSFDEASAARLIDSLIGNGVSFTGVLAGNDDIAVGAVRRLEERGVRVPVDVSVVGFDDVELAAGMRPALTTVRQAAQEMGRRAAQIVLKALVDDAPIVPASTVLPVELVIRESTAAPGAGASQQMEGNQPT
ncbi:LacI family DNA-binding transcriptional regulator [Agromyces sp. ISL-38]|uniref:LacI family DNA-binding transcriptional regulator n=1 Tax=Agromyces sp. ISL-38 TaxID=2819107 RepID=UPI001BE5E7A2|nr:LacI family DNA-binding transcriptional regulator [Agromyces sp. ISL-38]MBT2498038.1 LacI family DNA-binding transcriptional regulator [Agromyces sp. ISL-38]MBT2516886.1 LacI family DNA-binding transcriptional regulator [Streptomyces sp. ISL-90]